MPSDPEIDALTCAVAERLRGSGHRVTQQRLDVYRTLADSAEHPDAETVYHRVRRRLPSISLDTVYRTLAMLERAGFVSKVESGCDRVRYDANPTPHHHAVCVRCGLVRDLDHLMWRELAVPAAIPGFAVVGSLHIEVRGTCERCDKAERRSLRRAVACA